MPRPLTLIALTLTLAAGCQDGPPPVLTKAQRMAAADKDIIQAAEQPDAQQLGQWLRLVQAAGLVDELSGPGPFTVFAPDNDAFTALPPPMLEDLLSVEHKDRLRSLLLRHVHRGDAYLSSELTGGNLPTEDGGKPLAVTAANGVVTVNGAGLKKADVVCRNGILHWVDRVLTP